MIRVWSLMLVLFVTPAWAESNSQRLEMVCTHGLCCRQFATGEPQSPKVKLAVVAPPDITMALVTRTANVASCSAGSRCELEVDRAVLGTMFEAVTLKLSRAGSTLLETPLSELEYCRSDGWELAMRPGGFELPGINETAIYETALPDLGGAVKELFSILGEIAVRRATHKGARLIQKRIIHGLCSDSESLVRTCKLLRSLRLEDVAASARSVRNAVTADLFDHYLAAVLDKIDRQELRPFFSLLQDLGRQLAAGQVSSAVATRFVIHAVETRWTETREPTREQCVVQAAMVVVKQCVLRSRGNVDGERCNTVSLAHDLSRRQLSGVMVGCEAHIKGAVTNIERLAHAGAVIFEESARIDAVDPRPVVRALLRFAQLQIECLLGPRLANETRTKLAALTNLADAALAGDVARLLGYAVERIGSDDADAAKTRRAAAILNTVIAYIQVPRDEKNPEKAREQRKVIIENLIDEASNREGRSGEFIASLGIAVGGGLVGYERRLGPDEHDAYYLQIALPLGVALQWTPAPEGLWGFHIGLYGADLGQFVATTRTGEQNDISWDSGFGLTAQIGAILGSAENPFVFGGELKFAPTLFPASDGEGGAVRAGVFAQYYIPLFDLN